MYSNSGLKNVLLNFYSQSKEIQQHKSDAESRIFQLWKENLDNIAKYFTTFEEKFSDPQLKKSYNTAVEDFLRKLRVNPSDEFGIHISITILQYYLNKVSADV